MRVTRAAFHILVALADRDLHGLGLAEEIESMSHGELRMGPGVLYTTLKRLLEAGLVREVQAPEGADSRRRYYRLTDAGRQRASAEARAWRRTLEVADSKKLLDESAP